MKSIKEKSKEYADEQDLRMAYNGSCDNCRQGFEAGANYVLEQVEMLLNSQRFADNPSQELFELIGQLKKLRKEDI